MKKIVAFSIIGFFSTSLFGNSCDGLYQGKPIKLANTGLLGKTIDAVVTGVDKKNGMVSIKLTHNGEYREGTCSFLKKEMR